MSEPSYPSASPAPSAPTPSPSAAQRSWRPALLVAGGVAGTLCLCVAVVALLIVRGVFAISQEQAAITPVLQEFMTAMEARNVDAAYALFSRRAQRQTPRASLEEMIIGENYVLFDGYDDVTLDVTNLTNSFNTNDDLPQGTVATVNGSITYTGDVKGSVRAVLEKEDGVWRFLSINITVPPSKFGGGS